MSKHTIHSWNIQGIAKWQAELIHFLRENNLDIMGLNETRLLSNRTIKIHGYDILRKDRASGQGGIAVLLRNGVPYQQILHPALEHLQAVGIRLLTILT